MTQRLLKLAYLPDFAKYLKENCLQDLCEEQMRLLKEFNVPMYKHFSTLPYEQQISIAISTASELLDYLIANNPGEYIDKTIANWEKNLLPVITKTDIVSDDIAVFNYTRKRAFSKFLNKYTVDFDEALKIVDELDRFHTTMELTSFSAYMKMQETKIGDHLHFIEKINDTIPAIVYLFDFALRKT